MTVMIVVEKQPEGNPTWAAQTSSVEEQADDGSPLSETASNFTHVTFNAMHLRPSLSALRKAPAASTILLAVASLSPVVAPSRSAPTNHSARRTFSIGLPTGFHGKHRHVVTSSK
ncbi:hypothetical protein E3N88_26584 [Mikania micrantha]|uniref:Uncharacterized protein n=1 Tax=Mikania micrantha TaxID=192012 RepID=A0A5N6MU65_9ASTR|nr:hypothetical protein E3N88_26584 [Mikania micrantha]